MVEGTLAIRDAAEVAELPVGTAISGTNTDGALSAGSFSVPPIRFSQDITDPAPTSVDIEARFGVTGTNPVTGSIDPEGMVRVSARLKVDLDLHVAIIPSTVFTCSASPVNLLLEGRYDETTQRVTLVDEDFAVPGVSATDDCMALIANGINAQLQGPGHSLRLVMEGAITPPLDPGEVTTTTLAVTPTGGTAMGQEVTLTATVTPGPDAENADVPAGLVEFRDGSTRIGQVELDSTGTAVLVTDTLAAGPRRLTAHYVGTPPVYAASTSPVVMHEVTAKPVVTVESAAVRVGGDPGRFTVEVANSGYGHDIAVGRLEVAIQRSASGADIGPASGTPRVTLARVDGTGSTPVALTASGATGTRLLSGVLDPPEGLPLPAGTTRTVTLELGTSSALAVGTLNVTVKLVNATDDEPIADGVGQVRLVGVDRQSFTWLAGDVGLPPIRPATPAVLPVRARAGNSVYLYNLRPSATVSNLLPTGPVAFTIDGRPLMARKSSASAEVEWTEQYQILAGNTHVHLIVPADIGVGTKQIAVSYGGDVFYRPATAVFSVIIDPPVGPAYDCQIVGTQSLRFRAQLEAVAAVPAVSRPVATSLVGVGLKLHVSRHDGMFYPFGGMAGATDPAAAVALGPAGAISGTQVVQANNTQMLTDAPTAVDYTVSLQQPAGSVDLSGVAPGTEVPVTVEEMVFTYSDTTIGTPVQNTITCVPVGEALVLGRTTVAGTTIEAPKTVAVGADVVLSSVSLPGSPGVVEFLADGQTVGFAPTTDGTATVSTADLPAGSPVVRAVFRPAGVAPTTTSDPVEIRVVATCAPVEDGAGATVRLVYIELLGRCPDAAGYAYWVGQLDGGVSADVFARRISASVEARKVIVADAYRLLLDRNPDGAGATYWADRLGRNARYDDLLASIASSPEFRQRAGGTDTGVVTRLYERIIGRSPDAPGRDYWVGVLRTRGITAVVRAFVNLPEPLGAIVTASYQDLLDRAPTAGEKSAGITALRADGDRSALYASVIATDGFTERAQGFPELT